MVRYQQIPSVFNKEQISSLFDAIREPDVMMACIIGLFCGLRIGEIVKLTFNDIDLVKKQVKVLNGKMPGKNLAGYGKDRVVPIPPQIIPLIVLWKNMHPNTEYLFPSLSKGNTEHIAPEYLFKKYKQCLEKAGLIVFRKLDAAGHKKNLYNFHTLRHTYATLLWERTGDIYAVKKALGHSDLDTTLIYTHISDTALQQKINNAFEIPLPFKQNSSEIENVRRAPEQKHILQEPRTTFEANPIEILKVRLAKGEITLDNFRQLRTELVINEDTNYFG